MSQTSTAKSTDELYLEILEKLRNNLGRPVRMEEVGRYIHEHGLIPTPKVDVVALHVKKLKQAARRKRVEDLKGRKIRPWLAAKIARWTENGQQLLDVVWDHIHEMSLDHAFAVFDQRDEGIKKQKKSATRELQSFLEFNPNAAGHQQEFVFDFMLEEAIPSAPQSIEETIPPPATPYPPTQPR